MVAGCASDYGNGYEGYGHNAATDYGNAAIRSFATISMVSLQMASGRPERDSWFRGRGRSRIPSRFPPSLPAHGRGKFSPVMRERPATAPCAAVMPPRRARPGLCRRIFSG